MAHVQQQVLEAIKAALVAAGTAVGGRVFLDRFDPLPENQLPALKVSEAPQGEEVEIKTINGAEERTFSVLVTCVVSSGADYASRARDLGLAVEIALTARGLALPKGRLHIAAARITLDGEGDVLVAQREQLWRFIYTTRRGAPGVAI